MHLRQGVWPVWLPLVGCPVDRANGAVGLLKLVVELEAWLRLLHVREFGGSLHPVRMIEAKPDLFYPLLTSVIFE